MGMKSSNRISALLWADILVAFALFVMQDYLTDVWNLSFTHAAGILNIWNGISLVLQPFFLILVDSVLGNFAMLVVSSTAYSVGIGLVTMSTPPVLGTCNRYEEQCVGHTQKVLFYTGMALIAVGVAGNNVSVKPFLEEQEETGEGQGPNLCLKIAGAVFVVVVALTGAIALPYIKPWTLRFGIPAICTVVATALFLTGMCSCCWQYTINCADRSQLRSLCRVRMIPMLMTFVFCGLVSSIGNTYFVEQAKNLDRHLGKWNVPPQVLLLVQKGVSAALEHEKGDESATAPDGAGAQSRENQSRIITTPGKGVVIAVSSAILCCITAARMEFKRLGVVERRGLLDDDDADVPMSIFWLIFQFVLLGCLDKVLEKTVAKFNEAEFDDDENEGRYADNLAKGVSGLGYMCGVLSVYVVGEVSGRGGHRSWFQDTLNTSRLDRYYWVLAALGSVILVLYSLLSCFNRQHFP
ncbi:protein NRT1/ PTR FAMILY 5.5-like [Salvia hispanica]|uniref:protein NRT1/ PTR FAMILY 5.5-like n=1 Tax=Salvia hispanica TaxID=49212 RepID=UPI0020092134|nr:protein NRT1/ PTR FAMILY 5.5-like [Salvia hispanica]